MLGIRFRFRFTNTRERERENHVLPSTPRHLVSNVASGYRLHPIFTAIEAMQERDIIRSNWPNDGIRRGIRVVNDDGVVIEYR